MGSATSQALATARAALTAAKADAATGESLLAAGRVIGSSVQLTSAIADPGPDAAVKKALVQKVFGATVTPAALTVLETVATQRWSAPEDVLAGVEELGIRAIAASGGAQIDEELFSFGRIVSADQDLELALGSKLGDSAAKAGLVTRLLAGKASAGTVAILGHLVQQPRGRRIGELIRDAAAVVADQAGYGVATVTSASPVGAAQLKRLTAGLEAKYGRKLRVDLVVDPAVVGGIKVQVGDDVIDGTIAGRLADLRLQLAG